MLKTKTAKVAIGLVFALALVAAPAVNAQTTAELQAQIQSLLATIAQLQAQLGGATTGTAATFSKDLQVGSRGADVTALQTKLGVSPATGFFGPITKAAVVAYQKENGLPATGFVGPMTRGVLNAGATTTTTTGTTTTTTTTTPISTTGVEGSLSVTQDPSPASGQTIREGDSKKAIMGLDLQARLSDIKVERVKVDLGTVTTIFNRSLSNIYLMDGSTVVASSPLNSSTVTKEGTKYYITLANFSYLVPKDAKKVLTIAVDAYPSVSSAGQTTFSVDIPANGVRGVDGAGLNQYSPTSAFGNSSNITVAATLSDSATLTTTTDAATPVASLVIANDGSSNNEKDAVTIMKIDLLAQKDNLTINQLPVTLTLAGNMTIPTAYLYDGDTQVGSATVTGTLTAGAQAGAQTATFGSSTDLGISVPAGTTKVLTVKGDVRLANTSISSVTGSITTAQADAIVAVNSMGDTLADAYTSGSASGNEIDIFSKGPQITLVGTPTIAKSLSSGGVNGLSTSTATGTFNVQITAIGGNLTISSAAGTTVPGTSAGAAAFKLGIYRGGSLVATPTASVLRVASSTDFGSMPSAFSTTGVTGEYVLAQGQTATIPLTSWFEGKYSMIGDTPGGPITSGGYALGIEGFNWGIDGAGTTSSTYMAGKSDWRTGTVTMP